MIEALYEKIIKTYLSFLEKDPNLCDEGAIQLWFDGIYTSELVGRLQVTDGKVSARKEVLLSYVNIIKTKVTPIARNYAEIHLLTYVSKALGRNQTLFGFLSSSQPTVAR